MRVSRLVPVFLAVAGVCGVPSEAVARRRRPPPTTPDPNPNPTPDPNANPNGTTPPTGTEDPNGSMNFSTTDTQNPQPDPNANTQNPTGTNTSTDPSGLGGIGGEDVRARRLPFTETIASIQQIYALRNRRFELQPTANFSLNDPYVSHTGFGLAANFWITNVLAVGLNFIWFQGLNSRSDVDFRVARSANLVVPVNEYQMAAAANFSYVPVYGKFLMFNRFIFHWDLYVAAGVGFIRTRPIPVVDPEVRVFNYDFRILFNATVGLRVFFNRWIGIVGELHNYIYLEALENRQIADLDRPVTTQSGMTAACGSPNGPVCNSRQDPNTWIRERNAITDNVMLSVGLTVFLPVGVHYRLQK